jgi:hypothetical protein
MNYNTQLCNTAWGKKFAHGASILFIGVRRCREQVWRESGSVRVFVFPELVI